MRLPILLLGMTAVAAAQLDASTTSGIGNLATVPAQAHAVSNATPPIAKGHNHTWSPQQLAAAGNALRQHQRIAPATTFIGDRLIVEPNVEVNILVTNDNVCLQSRSGQYQFCMQAGERPLAPMRFNRAGEGRESRWAAVPMYPGA